MSQKLEIEKSNAQGSFVATDLHDALLNDPQYTALRGDMHPQEGRYYDCKIYLEHNDDTIWITIPDNVNATSFLARVEQERV